MPGHHGGSSSSSSSSSTNQGPAGGQSSGGNYSGGGSTSNNGAPGGNHSNNNNNTVDHGFQQALKEQEKRQADPVYGDPDPQVDVDPRDRDSITSFKDNYVANVKSNPMYLGIGGLLHTAYQTGQAKSML